MARRGLPAALAGAPGPESSDAPAPRSGPGTRQVQRCASHGSCTCRGAALFSQDWLRVCAYVQMYERMDLWMQGFIPRAHSLLRRSPVPSFLSVVTLTQTHTHKDLVNIMLRHD